MPQLTAEQKARRIAALKKDEEEYTKDNIKSEKEIEKYKKSPEGKKLSKQIKELKPIIQQFIDDDITYSELKKYCLKNDIMLSAYIPAYSSILNNYDTTFHETQDYDELDKADKKLWIESYNNQKIINPKMKKLSKISDILREKEHNNNEEKNEKSEDEKPIEEVKKKKSKKTIIGKLQNLCNELNG